MLYLYLSKSIDLKFALLLHPKLIRRGLCDLQSFDILAAATFSEQTKQCFGETSTKDGQTVHEDNLSMFLFHCYFLWVAHKCSVAKIQIFPTRLHSD